MSVIGECNDQFFLYYHCAEEK